jgi:hypothetical protein
MPGAVPILAAPAPVTARRLVQVALGAALASCEGRGPVSLCACPPILTLNPASLAMGAGNSASLTVTVAGAEPERAAIRVASQRPAVVRVDTVTRSGVPVAVRASAAGAAVVLVTVTRNGQTVTGSLPVTVTARPPL